MQVTRCLPLTKKADGTDAKNAPAVIRLCTDRLREFIRDPDQNLKYLGLMGLWSLMRSHPRVVAGACCSFRCRNCAGVVSSGYMDAAQSTANLC